MKYYSILVTLPLLFVLQGCGPNSFHARCDILALTSKLDYKLEFDMEPDRQSVLVDDIAHYLDDSGFVYQSSKGDFFSSPDSNGKQTKYLNFKVIGCNYKTIVWAENPATSRHFVLTVHQTIFGSRTSSLRRATDLKKIVIDVSR